MSGRKGNEAEKMAKTALEEAGYVVHKVAHTGRFMPGRGWISGNNDVLGCDIIAIKLGERPRFIQVTATGDIGRKADILSAFPWPTEHASVEVWLLKKKRVGRGVERWFQVRRMDREWIIWDDDIVKVNK